MLIAALALVGLFVAMYLLLYKLGYIGTLSCKIGSCEKVNTSPYAVLLGVPVSFWGVLYYIALFATAFASTTERLVDDRRMAPALVVLTGWGVLFSGYLTYLEAAVIHAWCQWCVISAILVVIMFVLALLELRSAGAGQRTTA